MFNRLSFVCFLFVAGLITVLLGTSSLKAESPPLKLAVVSSLTGRDTAEDAHGRWLVEGVRLAIEEANAESSGPRIELEVYDEQGSDAGARAAATKIAAGNALAVIGPMFSTSSMAAGPIFAAAGLASIAPAAESDLITSNPTTYRTTFKNSDLGDWLASYLRYILDGKRAVVLYADDAYGRTIADGFRRGADRLGIQAAYYGFTGSSERDEAVRRAAAEPGHPTIVLGMLETDAASAVVALRRQGVTAPMLGGTDLSEETFAQFFRDLPEERANRGFFTKNLYAAVPVMFDSANDATLDFADRFKERFGKGQSPVSWITVQGYDAGLLAVAALREAAAKPASDLPARRAAVLAYLDSLNGPSRAVAGVVGPIWFTPDHGRTLPIRMGRFREALFESAPLQLVPSPTADPGELAAGSLVEIAPGHYAHRQKVVYAGIFLNEVARIDIAQSTFTADFYVWMRFAPDPLSTDADPTQIEFPHMVRGNFASNRPADGRDLDDGTTYRLWRINADFKNDFHLQRYPADRQLLDIQFFNARIASDRLVYVVDRSALSAATPAVGAASHFNGAAEGAFRNLTQWQPLRVTTILDNLVAQSALGDPGLVGLERMRELSGFKMQIEVQRDIGTTLIKTLLPIGLMTLIMFATLFFPPVLAGAKVTVAITAGLSGAVLLSAINTQLGNVGYVIAVEYGFYVFFTLCLVCIVSVLVSERLRVDGRSTVAVDWIGRVLFMAGFLGTVVAATVAIWQWR